MLRFFWKHLCYAPMYVNACLLPHALLLTILFFLVLNLECVLAYSTSGTCRFIITHFNSLIVYIKIFVITICSKKLITNFGVFFFTSIMLYF